MTTSGAGGDEPAAGGAGGAARRARGPRELLLRLLEYAWPPSAKRLADPDLRNRGYLRDRLIALPLLAVVAFAAFGWAYGTVRDDSAYLRERIMPTLSNLAQARISVQIAQVEARTTLRSGEAAELSGLSELYRTRMRRTTQSLAAVAQSGALDVPQQQELRVINALLVDYGGWVNRAQGHAGDTTLREAELSYAGSMLCAHALSATDACRAATGAEAIAIVDRVRGLERELRQRLDERRQPDGGVWAAAAVSGVCFVLLAVGLWRTVFFLDRRLRIRPNIPLLLAALPLLVVPFLVTDAVLAKTAQNRVRTHADDLAEKSSLLAETVADHQVFGGSGSAAPDPDDPSIAEITTSADRTLAGGGFGPLGAVRPFVIPAGLLSAAIAGGALYTYRREYLFVARPGAVS